MRPIEGFLKQLPAVVAVSFVSALLACSVPAAAAETEDARPPYTIGIGDVLEVFVYEEDARETCLVRPDGQITLPLVGDILAAGLTPEGLRASIAEALSKYQEEPTVSVAVREINSYRIYVLGKVATQQAIESDVPLRLLQALAMAGGANDFANGEVLILREAESGQTRLEIDYEAIIKGRTPDRNVWLRADDVVVVQ